MSCVRKHVPFLDSIAELMEWQESLNLMDFDEIQLQ